MILSIITAITMWANSHAEPQPKFYDGEGNTIPIEAVQMLVKAQFVWLDSTEYQTINTYFYK